MKPQRIQRKRVKGWKSPNNCKYCGRPTKWGNPFRDIGDMVYIYSLNRTWLDPWVYFKMQSEHGNAVTLYQECVLNNAMVWLYCSDLDPLSQAHWFGYFSEISQHLHELRQYDYLSCFCPLDQKCHVDVLIEML